MDELAQVNPSQPLVFFRVRASINRTDPLRQRVRWITRHRYCIPGANSLWHVDGHHRSRFIIHVGIDGYSRMIVFLKCSTNNSSATVMNEVYHAIPLNLVCYQGGENILGRKHTGMPLHDFCQGSGKRKPYCWFH